MFETNEENNVTFNESEFEKLKNYFKEDINSNRRFEQILTIEELVSVLEDRNALTDDVLLNCGPQFINFVKVRRENHSDLEKLIIPKNVVRFVSQLFPDDWELLGVHLKLKEHQMKHCQNAEDILFYHVKNSEGISRQEMIFRLSLGLEKCGKLEVRKTISELMRQN